MNIPMIVLGGGVAVTLAIVIKRNGFPGSEKAASIAAIKVNMAEALNANNTELYEMYRLELENEREL